MIRRTPRPAGWGVHSSWHDRLCRGHVRSASCSQGAADAYGVQEKLLNYSLKAGHPRGKAPAFARALGVTADDLEYVAEALLLGVRTTPLSGVRAAGVHGFHCEVIVQVRGLGDRADRAANVLTA